MIVLGLDTATLTLSAALVERSGSGRDRVLERVSVPPPTPHSALLPSLLVSMLGRAGLGPSDLGAVVVGLGPGSFTGLRIGLATAKGLCYAARVPLVGGSSLAAMASAAAPDCPGGALLVPCLDARKGEVYAGFFRNRPGRPEPEAPEEALTPEALLERLAGERGAVVFGLGRDAYLPLRGLSAPPTAVATPDAEALVRLATVLPPFDRRAVFSLEPHYVRPSDSEWTPHPRKT